MVSPLGPGTLHPAIAEQRVRSRTWNGIQVETAEFWCTGEVLHELPFGDALRLSAVLEEVGGACEPREHRHKVCPVPHTPKHMHIAPAGMRLWGYSGAARYVRDVTLVFDSGTLESRLGESFLASTTNAPRLRFSDPAITSLLDLLVDAIDHTDPSSTLYGDGLTTALTARLFAPPVSTSRTRPMLASWQLRRVVEYLDTHLSRPVALEELAQVVGLSQRHFARAFKAATGQSPYRWHVERRIARAQVLLLRGDSLETVAGATGFLDASHFGRVFRQHVGLTPGTWRHERNR